MDGVVLLSVLLCFYGLGLFDLSAFGLILLEIKSTFKESRPRGPWPMAPKSCETRVKVKVAKL